MSSVEKWLDDNVPHDGKDYKVCLRLRWEGYTLILKKAQVELV